MDIHDNIIFRVGVFIFSNRKRQTKTCGDWISSELIDAFKKIKKIKKKKIKKNKKKNLIEVNRGFFFWGGGPRSASGRVGKECGSWGGPVHIKKKNISLIKDIINLF